MKKLFGWGLTLAACATSAAWAQAQDDVPGDPRAVVESYYRAIDAKDYETAYQLWFNGGKSSGKSLRSFKNGFKDTAETEVQVQGAGEVHGAAGSLYTEVPVDVNARLTNGRRQHFTGTYTLRAVNRVDGSDPASWRWHLHSARLKAAPVTSAPAPSRPTPATQP